MPIVSEFKKRKKGFYSVKVEGGNLKHANKLDESQAPIQLDSGFFPVYFEKDNSGKAYFMGTTIKVNTILDAINDKLQSGSIKALKSTTFSKKAAKFKSLRLGESGGNVDQQDDGLANLRDWMGTFDTKFGAFEARMKADICTNGDAVQKLRDSFKKAQYSTRVTKLPPLLSRLSDWEKRLSSYEVRLEKLRKEARKSGNDDLMGRVRDHRRNIKAWHDTIKDTRKGIRTQLNSVHSATKLLAKRMLAYDKECREKNDAMNTFWTDKYPDNLDDRDYVISEDSDNRITLQEEAQALADTVKALCNAYTDHNDLSRLASQLYETASDLYYNADDFWGGEFMVRKLK